MMMNPRRPRRHVSTEAEVDDGVDAREARTCGRATSRAAAEAASEAAGVVREDDDDDEHASREQARSDEAVLPHLPERDTEADTDIR